MKREKPTSLYIGDKQVKEIQREGDEAVVIFKDKSDVKLKDELLAIITSEKPREGTVMDVVRHVLASKFLSELADYGVEIYLVEHIGQGMATLAHNMREEAIGEAFGCNSSMDIKISQLLD